MRRVNKPAERGTSEANATGSYPKVKYRSSTRGSVLSAGTLLLTETARVLGVVDALTTELGGFARPLAIHHPGKAICDLAVMLAAGGDCPADVAMLRARPHLFGMVASDPTISRILDDLAGDAEAAIAGLLPGGALPAGGGQVIVDIDATLVTSHSEKELAAPKFKRGFGFHPILAFADHIAVLDLALAQLDPDQRARVLVRTDSAGGTKVFTVHLRTAIDRVDTGG